MKPTPRLALPLALVLALALFLTAQASAASPSQLFAASIKAAQAQRSVHYVAKTTSATATITIVADSARTSGVQHITFQRGSHTGHVTVIVASGVAYVNGDAFTLNAYMGIPSLIAIKHAHQWIKIPPSSPLFKPVAAAVRLDSSLTSQLGPPPPHHFTSTKKATVSGQSALELSAAFTISSHTVVAHLYLAAASKLPISETLSAKGERETSVFSRWNEKVTVKAPTKSILVTKLH